MNENEKANLEHRIADIDKRRAEIEVVEKTLGPRSYRAQELEAERVDLMRLRSTTTEELRALNATDKPLDPQRAKLLDELVVERKESVENFIKKLEREGDWRQVRIWKMELLDIRRQVAKEYGLV
jgi:small-conductance mechanosensitive channel